jgi:AmmeMemoRadiSam system protein B
MSDVRPSPIAGRWYPGSPAELAQSVDRYLAEAEVEPPAGELIGLVAPHAGHMYSGRVAAHAFKCVQGLEVDCVAVLSPSHYVDLAPLLTTTHEAYRTPLGEVPVDREAVAEIAAAVSLRPIPRDPEHALEIELPFLQRALGRQGRFTLIPVMMRDQTPAVAEALAHALAAALRGRRALLVASSDLSHFYPQPVADSLDAYVLERINEFDPAGVLAAEETGRGFACGKGAIAAVLWAARDLGASHARVVKHQTSGDVTGDYDSVVGYGAAVIWK